MKKPVTAVALVLAVVAVCWIWITQAGNLEPPGPLGSTMRTLDEVEPRTPITSLPFMVDASGSYYLITNLTGTAGANGITIVADKVTLDLNGFSVVGVPGSLSGIRITGENRDLSIFNGSIKNWGVDGVTHVPYKNSRSVLLHDLRVLDNEDSGIIAGEGAIVDRCTASGNGDYGIAVQAGSVVSDSVASFNTTSGNYAGIGARDSLVIGNTAIGNVQNIMNLDGNSTLINNHAP